MLALRSLNGKQGMLGYVLQQTPLAGRAWRASELVRLLSHSSLSKLERRVSERIREAGSEAQMKLNSLLTLRVAIKSATLG